MGLLSLTRKRSIQIFCVVLGSVFSLYAFCMGGSETGRSQANHLEGIKPFPLDYESGSMALHALRSCAQAYDVTSSYQRLVGLSGSAFKFVYDSTEAYEPLRDLYPVDVLRRGADALGFHEARWEINESIEAVKMIIKREIDDGHPVLSPFLKTDAYHGFFIITGYDYDRDVFYLQGAFETASPDVEVAIPEGWDGPTASPAGWASNPIFVIGKRSRRGQGIRMTAKGMIEESIDLIKGGRLGYGVHPGEGTYMSRPGPYEAAYGLPAYDLLLSDIRAEKLVLEGDGGEMVNFGLIWRIDSQVGQLEHDRGHGAVYLRTLASLLPQEKVSILTQLTQNVEKTTDDARRLRDVFWHEIPDTLELVGEITEYVKESSSIVLKLPDVEGIEVELQRLGFNVFKTPWGWVLIDDSYDKRLSAAMLAKSIATRERFSLGMLEEIRDCIGMLQPVDRPGGKRGPRNRR